MNATTIRAGLLAAALPLILLVVPSGATAKTACARFDERLTITTNVPGDYAAIGFAGSPKRLTVSGGDASGGATLDCAGSPTIYNVEEIRMVDLSGGDARHNIVSPDEFRALGIAIDSDLGSGEGDRMTLFAGGYGDMIHLSRTGAITLPTQSFDDPGITFSGVDAFVLQGGQGNDSLSGDPKDGEHRPVAQPLTINAGPSVDEPGLGTDGETLIGGEGRDQILGGTLNDTILGGAGDDLIEAGTGSDFVRGGAGRDRLASGAGPDVIDARDGARDRSIDCGTGRDAFRIDEKRDRRPRGCERRFRPAG